MRTYITLDTDNETPLIVSMVDHRVIQSQVFGVPVILYMTDIVHITHQGIKCFSKIRDIKIGQLKSPNVYDGDRYKVSNVHTVQYVKSPCLWNDPRIHSNLGVQGITRTIPLQADIEEPPQFIYGIFKPYS